MPPRNLKPPRSLEVSSDTESEDALAISRRKTRHKPSKSHAKRKLASHSSRSSRRVEKTKLKAKPAPQTDRRSVPREASRSVKHGSVKVEKRADSRKVAKQEQSPKIEEQTGPLGGEKQITSDKDAQHALSRAVYALECTSARNVLQIHALETRKASLKKDVARYRAKLKELNDTLSGLERTHATAVGDLSRARAEQAALEAEKAELEELLDGERRERERAEKGLEEKAHEARVYRCAIAVVFKLPGTVREMAMMREVVGLVYERMMRKGALRMMGVDDAGEGGWDEGDGDGEDEGSDEDDEDPLAEELEGSESGASSISGY